MIVKRWDIAPAPEHLRPLLPADRRMDFPVDTTQSIYDFCLDNMIARIALRPLLIYQRPWSNRTSRDCKMAFILIDGAGVSQQ